MKIVYPHQTEDVRGTLLIPNTACMIANAKNPDTAQQFIDFLISPEVEEYLAKSRSKQIPLNPNVDLDLSAEELPLPFRDYEVLAVDWEAAAEELDAVQEEFQKLFIQ